MMIYGQISKERVKDFAEIFTPAHVVFDMILEPHMRSCLQDVDKTMLDPAVGMGQFPCAELVWKLFFNVERLDEDLALRALKSLHGRDIQSDSVILTREHLLQTLCDTFKYFTGQEFGRLDEARHIVEENILQSDFMEEFAAYRGDVKKKKPRRAKKLNRDNYRQ